MVKTEEYVAMLHRMVDALAGRLADDPAGLVHIEPLRQHRRDAMSLAIATNHESHAATPSANWQRSSASGGNPSTNERSRAAH